MILDVFFQRVLIHSEVKNPISVARGILRASTEPLPSNGLLPPALLAGKGAADYAFENGLVTLPPDGLVSPDARMKWVLWLEQLRDANITANRKAFLRRPVKSHFLHFLGTSPSDTTIGSPPNADTNQEQQQQLPSDKHDHDPPDNVTDTVGAIAVDLEGNIAAGSSSGGVAMKHSGRVGPAALVGLGTAVIPAHEGDPDGTCVAVVTSGTGEHISTTMAASSCAWRIYHCERKNDDGSVESITEEEAMEAMIETDFMGNFTYRSSLHPDWLN